MDPRKTLAKQAARLKRTAQAPARLPSLWLVTDETRLPDPRPAARSLPRGAGVILRHYADPSRERLARDLLRICRRRRLVLLVAGDPKLARRVGADGVHLPEALVRRVSSARALGLRLVTVAAHSRTALVAAERAGADAALLSPVFVTASHPGATGLDALRFAGLVHGARLPVIALGGIRADTAPRLAASGASGLAAIDGLAGVVSDRPRR